MQYVKKATITMRSHPVLSEKWLQQRIIEDPEILGFGDVTVHDVEKTQPKGGRLDLLLSDAESNTRYEVELQLGATDESHIIRSIEYWDLERRRYPQYDHVAVIVAEEITSRFFNVISLFNGFIPIVAIQVTALQVADDEVTLLFTRILDHQVLAADEDDAGGVADRAYWEKRASTSTMSLVDELLLIAQAIDAGVALNFNRAYVGLARNGVASNFVAFRPRRKTVSIDIRLNRTDDLDRIVDDAGIDTLPYKTRWGQYRPVLRPGELETHADVLCDLFRRAHDQYHS